MQVERTTADGRAGGTSAVRETAVRETAVRETAVRETAVNTCIGLKSSHALM